MDVADGVERLLNLLRDPALSTVVLTISAFVIVFQTRQIAIQTRSLVYQEIARQMQSIDYLFIEQPLLRECFYDSGCNIEELDEAERQKVLATAELIVDFIDNVLFQRKFLRGYPWNTWDRYFCDLMVSKPVKAFMEDSKDWYPENIVKYYERCNKTRRAEVEGHV